MRALLPFVSLATGVASALTMHRDPAHAKLVAIAAALLWLALVALRTLPSVTDRKSRTLALGLLRRASLMATQSAVQLGFFFALPFYAHAASSEIGHVLFMFALVALCAASLWDPLTAHLYTRPLLGPLLPAISSFVALNAVLPGLGLSTHQSLRVAAWTAVVGVALTTAASAPRPQRAQGAAKALLLAGLLPFALELGAARLVPAAPLRLVKIEFGTELRDHWVAKSIERLDAVPAHLYCASAIASPIGVRDRLFHVWRYGGKARERVELTIRGGRLEGYRTYSRIDHFGAKPSGVYSCSVETASGQVLGSRTLRLTSPGG